MNTILGIVIVIVVILVGWFAYSQGYFAAQDEDEGGIQIELGGSAQ